MKVKEWTITSIETHIATFCNKCGEECTNLKKSKSFLKESVHVEKRWGYHSNKDGEIHDFDICEDCYDKFVKTFKIPVEVDDCL